MNSFSSDDWSLATTNNTIIDSEIEYWRSYGSGIYPSVVINNRTYRGQLEPLALFNALCSGFSTPPTICAASLGNYQPDFLEEDSSLSAGAIVLLVIALILVNLLIWYCYRRSTKREMQGEMQMQIESAVSQYFALSQKEGGRVSVR